VTIDDSAPALLRRALERATWRTVAERLPVTLPAVLVDDGVWSPAEALERVDCPPGRAHPLALAELAPRLPAALARAALARADTSGESFHAVAGLVALVRRLVDLGAANEAHDALTRLPPRARDLVVARVADRLPDDLRASALALPPAEFAHSGSGDACVARLMHARLRPDRRDALVDRALFDLGEFPVEPFVLRWMARAGAVARAVALARTEGGRDDLAAVIPWCAAGRERAELWARWREGAEQALVDRRRRAEFHLPLPALPDELAELGALARAHPQPRERAALLAHLAVHHRAYVDEALAAARRLDVLDRVLGLASLLPALAGELRHAVAREAWALVADLDVDRESISDRFVAWPGPVDEPQDCFGPYTPTLPDLRARVVAHLAPGERRPAALALLSAALRIDDAHYGAAALSALGAHLPDADARARVFARAESLALASNRPWIGLAHLLARVDPEARPQLARRALASLPDELDDETLHALPALLAALPAADAAALVVRVVEEGQWSVVNDLRAIVDAALRAGAVAPLAELFLGDAGRREADYVLPRLLRHADAELRPRIAAAVLEPFEEGSLYDFPDIVAAVPWLSPAERERLVARIPAKKLMTKTGTKREPLIVALARPLAEQGALELVRPLLASVGRTRRLVALASALPFLDPAERDKVIRQICGDVRRGDDYLAWLAAPDLAAAGHADLLVEQLASRGVHALARIAGHVSPDQRPRLLELMTRAAVERPESITGADLRALGPVLRELPRDVLARACERVLAGIADSGRPDLLQALVVEPRDDDDDDAVDPVLTRALVELAGPTGLPACIALLDDLASAPRRELA
jgi:hypothetical protein